MTEYRSRPWRRHLRHAAARLGFYAAVAAALVCTFPALLSMCGVRPR